MKYIDVHAHYDDDAFKTDFDEIICKANSQGIDYIINSGSSFEGSIKALELARKYSFVYCSIGIHPEFVDEVDKLHELENFLCKAKENKIVAIGEIGLDYHYGKDNKYKQIDLFKRQLKLAIKYDMPVQIHSRDAVEDMLNILRECELPKKIMFHCYELNEEITKLIIDRGYSVSFGGNITYKRKIEALEQIKRIPLEQIMLETDSPYLSPEPLRGTRNDSKNIPLICEKLSSIKEMDVLVVQKQCYLNAINFYNLNDYAS